MDDTIFDVNSLVYLDVPSSGITPSDVQLMFNFAAGAATRSWNIKIAMLPCGASYLGIEFISSLLACLMFYIH